MEMRMEIETTELLEAEPLPYMRRPSGRPTGRPPLNGVRALTPMEAKARWRIRQRVKAEGNPNLRCCVICGYARDLREFCSKRDGSLTKSCAECRERNVAYSKRSQALLMALKALYESAA
jgi:hypothetical protein